MRLLVPTLRSLQLRLLAVLALTVAVALGTVALVARAATQAEFERYVHTSKLEMQSVAEQIEASTGERFLVTNTTGRVILDSSGELQGRLVEPELTTVRRGPAPAADTATAGAPVDVVFIQRSADAAPASNALWTVPLPAPPETPLIRALPTPALGAQALITDDREQVFVSAVTKSLVVGVLVGAVAAVALAVTFSRGILRPISALTVAARRMEQGDLSQRVSVAARDEIGQLGHAFNAMADALDRTERLRRTMVTDVAHELRTPLTNVRGYLEAIRDGVAEPRAEVIETLFEEALLLSQLVDDLQDLALSEAGQLSLRREPLDPRLLLLSAAQAIQPRARDQQVDLVVHTEPPLPLVDADANRVGQVLRNLLANALTHTPPGGSIHLSAERHAELLRVDVRDTGCGIAPEHVANVFERFYRADAARARSTGGAGIGLAVVRQLVEAHGGSVGVTSGPGWGTRFTFTLPLALATGQTGSRAALPWAPGAARGGPPPTKTSAG